MVNTSAADLLLQLKEFMTYGETLPLDSSSGAARTLDLTRLLTRINRSNTLIEQQVSDISDWPYPVRLQSAGVGLLLGAYALIILSSLLGNLFVIFVIIKMRRMHTATNVFILNVAISDVLITALNIPFSLARVLMDEWPFGSVMCRLMPFIQVVGVYSSSWTMVCIAIDRLIVTVYPLRPRMRISTGILLVIFVWLGSIAAALPYGMIHQTITTISFRTTARYFKYDTITRTTKIVKRGQTAVKDVARRSTANKFFPHFYERLECKFLQNFYPISEQSTTKFPQDQFNPKFLTTFELLSETSSQ